MNIAITDGVVLMPPPFAGGLDVWSSEDGTPGSATYQGAANAAFVPADQDFAGCLELLKTTGTQKLRWMGLTPILPGVYLRITARIKAMSGTLPSVRIAGWAGGSGGGHVGGLVEIGPATALSSYGEVVEVSAIVGAGLRGGVDMVWRGATFGHFGLDLTGGNGGIVRIDDIVVEDITVAFLRKMMDWVDVRDYGAIGNGVTDDLSAFNAANAGAAGRGIVVPAGVYNLGDNLTLDAPVRFEGSVTLPAAKRLVLRQNFDLPAYVAAFGGDEVEGFRRAFQALLNFTDHESLDMKGLKVEVTAPIDMQAAEGVMTTFDIRRVIRNGQFNVVAGSAWDPTVVSSAGTYNPASERTLSSVANIANVPVGARVTGTGVGREVYVTAKNVGAQSLTLSLPLWGAATTQTYTFTRYKYVLDFSGFDRLSKFTLADIEFQCAGAASGILLAPVGETFHVRDCFMTKPGHRGITSHGRGCQDLQIDRCHFTSNELPLAATARISVAFNVNSNDAKIRDNRFQHFGLTGMLYGNGHLIVGNHWFQGDSLNDAPRVAGMVFSLANSKSVLTGNYIDNCFVELTNEHESDPDFASQFSFGGLTMTGNIFTTIEAASWFSWIVVKPYGSGHFVHGLVVTGNTFKAINGNVARIETLDASIAGLNFGMTRNLVFEGNTFNGVNQITQNPVTLAFTQATAAATWTLNVGAWLPFGGWARTVVSVLPDGAITDAANAPIYAMPAATPNFGASGNQVRLTWPVAVKGKVQLTARTDNPA